MVKDKTMVLFLLLASATFVYGAATNYYWDYAETPVLEDNDRILVYKGYSMAGRDRNILGSKIARIGQRATFTNISVTTETATRIHVGPITPTPLLGYTGYIYQSGIAPRIYQQDSSASSYTPNSLWYSGPSDNQFVIYNVASGASISSIPGSYTTIHNRMDTPQAFISQYIFSPSLFGGESVGTSLQLRGSTSTGGIIKFGDYAAYDEAQKRLGVGTQSPTSPLHVLGLPTYGGATMAAANTAAKAAGLTAGSFFKYSTTDSRVAGVVW